MKKLVGILVMTLLIAATVSAVAGIMNYVENDNKSVNILEGTGTEQEIINEDYEELVLEQNQGLNFYDCLWTREQDRLFPTNIFDFVGIRTRSPLEELHVKGFGWIQARFQSYDSSGGIDLVSSEHQTYEIQSSNYGEFIIYDRTDERYCITIDDNGNVGIGENNPDEKLHVDGAIKLTGGGDIAEPFDIKEKNSVVPGMIVVIDSENPGGLKISDKAYDRCVAGIVSGAGGINPGLMLTQDDVFDGSHHVAIAGRVYGLCDASKGAIEPGDLLTTSSHPGYAMKVTDYDRAQGAVIGKAMTGLSEGQGLLLILVSLQ